MRLVENLIQAGAMDVWDIARREVIRGTHLLIVVGEFQLVRGVINVMTRQMQTM